MGRQDVPTFIDFILHKTGLENISYVGHSEGTTQFFLGASLIPEYYTSKVNLFVALAPVATTQNVAAENLVTASNHINEIVAVAIDALHIYDFSPSVPLASETIDLLCFVPYLNSICKDFFNITQDRVNDPVASQIMWSNMPAGSGWRVWVYYGQMMHDKLGFRLYDHGDRVNKKIYG